MPLLLKSEHLWYIVSTMPKKQSHVKAHRLLQSTSVCATATSLVEYNADGLIKKGRIFFVHLQAMEPFRVLWFAVHCNTYLVHHRRQQAIQGTHAVCPRVRISLAIVTEQALALGALADDDATRLQNVDQHPGIWW